LFAFSNLQKHQRLFLKINAFRRKDILLYYSFCFRTYSTADLIKAAVEHGITTLTLCNINSTYYHWEFVKLCHEAGIKPVLNVSIRNKHQHCYLLIVKIIKAYNGSMNSYHIT